MPRKKGEHNKGNDEIWICNPPGRGGRLRAALVYPNSYWVGMSNLGYQAVLRAFIDRAEFDVRRVFWDGSRLQFPDGGRALNDFDIVAFSVSFQPDLVHLPRMLEAGRAMLPSPGRPRPLLLAGGVALTINPEPAAPLMDVIVVGESEPFLEKFFDLLLPGDSFGRFEEILHGVCRIPGAYVPSLYNLEESAAGMLLPRPVDDAPERVERTWLRDLDSNPARPAVLTRQTEFGSMYPLEISRGCPAGCHFCAASAVCRPVRFLGKDRFVQEIETGLRYRKKIGLVGTAVSYHPGLADLAGEVLDRGGSFTPSSIRLERLTPELAGLLFSSGHKTVSIAPESASEKLRRNIGKEVPDSVVMNAVDLLQESGIPSLKLYFMLGLPGEENADVQGIIDLAENIRARLVKSGKKSGRVGTLTISVNPFVPKPHTALERSPMAEEAVLFARLKKVRDGLGRLGGVRVQTGSVRGAYLDGLISLGDRSSAQHLGKIPRTGLSLKRLDRLIPDASRLLLTERVGELPWDLIRNRSTFNCP